MDNLEDGDQMLEFLAGGQNGIPGTLEVDWKLVSLRGGERKLEF